MSIFSVRLAGSASRSWQSSIGERRERWLLLSLYSIESLGSIVALIDPSYLISNYVTFGLVPCTVCLAGMPSRVVPLQNQPLVLFLSKL